MWNKAQFHEHGLELVRTTGNEVVLSSGSPLMNVVSFKRDGEKTIVLCRRDDMSEEWYDSRCLKHLVPFDVRKFLS